MKKNMGNADRAIRLFLAVLFSVLYFTKTVSGLAGIILLIFGAVFVFTSFVNFCPLYKLLGINSCPVKK